MSCDLINLIMTADHVFTMFSSLLCCIVEILSCES